MKDFVIECGEVLQKAFPNMSWDEAMHIITTDCQMSRQVQEIVRNRKTDKELYRDGLPLGTFKPAEHYMCDMQ